MDSDDGSNILLNLTTVTPVESETVKVIKYRKKIDRQNDTQRKAKLLIKSEKSMGINSKTDWNKQQKVLGNESHEKFEVISSLFRKNPEMPDISSAVLCSPDHVKKNDETFSISEFKQMNLDPFMISNLEKNLHLIKMTSVQKASMPSLLDGKDVFIKSPTGTGKTLSYVIPLIQSLQAIVPKIKRVDGPYCLILVPTRELACQTLKVVQEVLKPFIWIVPGSVTGGEKRKSEKARLRKGINVLVATPGRLVDHLKTTKCLRMSQLKWLILDEADRLLDLGFEKDLGFILSTVKDHTSGKVQKVLLSATLSRGVKNLLDVNMENPVTINMAEESQLKHVEYQTPNLLEQFCVVVPMKLRLVTLAAFLQQKFQENCKVIVFFTTQDSVDFHFELYSSALIAGEGGKLNFMKLHGKLSQNERAEVFTKFKESDQGILLCTDVASRGLDLPSVNWIVQYNPPVSPIDYVHRVGRTARIGMSGQALLFLLPSEVSFLDILCERKLRVSELNMNEILTSFAQTLIRDRSTKNAISEDELRKLVTEQHMKFEENVRQNKHLKQLALTAFRSFIGAYNTFPSSVKHIFHPRNLHLGHLAKSFGLREAPSELKRKFSTGGKSQYDGRKVKSTRTFSNSSSKSGLPEPMTKKLKRK